MYRSSPLALPPLKDAGIDLVNLANNHVMDYGPEGLQDTMNALDQEGIKRMGAGQWFGRSLPACYYGKRWHKDCLFGFSRVVPEASWKAGPGRIGVAETYNYKPPVEAIQKRELMLILSSLLHIGASNEATIQISIRRIWHTVISMPAQIWLLAVIHMCYRALSSTKANGSLIV